MNQDFDKLASRLKSLFVVRDDIYAKGYLTAQGKKAFQTIKEPLTLDLLKQHLEGLVCLGTYNLTQDSKVKWGCLDFDENTSNDFENAKKVYNYLINNNFHPMLEKSGGGEFKVHIWIFSEELIPADQMITFLKWVCEQTGVKSHEIFPKQPKINEGEFGNLVKLPLGKNPASGKFSEILNTNLEFHFDNKDNIPLLSLAVTKKVQSNPIIPHRWDSFFYETLKLQLPEGVSKQTTIGSKEAGINNNIIKNQARWFFEKGYNEERLKIEIKPIYDSQGWAFNDLLGWFHKAERGQILEVNERELKEWVENYSPSLNIFFPQKNNRNVQVELEQIKVLTYQDFENLKIDKNYIVQDFLKPNSVTMVYSPPAQFKTILMRSLGMCISSGKNWLGLKTKKVPVLYLDGENGDSMIAETMKKIYKGSKFTRKNFPFYTLKSGLLMDSKKNINIAFLVFLERLIEEKGIKVIFFDTLHRFAYYDENKSDDTNKVYMEIFKPLKEKYNLSIVFLHHSTKETSGRVVYRGSGDFLGMVDVSYQVKGDKKDKKFIITNEKNRSGEIAEIRGQIFFEEDKIIVERLNETQEEEKGKNKFLELCEKIMIFFDRSSMLTRKDLMTYLDASKFEYSRATFDRALKWLVEKKQSLTKDEKGRYILSQ